MRVSMSYELSRTTIVFTEKTDYLLTHCVDIITMDFTKKCGNETNNKRTTTIIDTGKKS